MRISGGAQCIRIPCKPSLCRPRVKSVRDYLIYQINLKYVDILFDTERSLHILPTGSQGGSTFCECSAHPYTANAWILSMLRIVGYSLYCECSASLDTANARQTSLLLTLDFSLYCTSCKLNTMKINKEVHVCFIFECLPKA